MTPKRHRILHHLACAALLACAMIPARAVAGGEEVRFTTSDNIVITGTFHAAARSAPAVLCLHQWRSDRTGFDPIIPQLIRAGFNVLAIDMRGNGGSVKTTDGRTIEPDRSAQKDVEAAIGFLRKQATVAAGRIAIIGASYGASNAVLYAAGDPSIAALVLLSPGMNYFNVLPIEPAVRKLGGRPVLLLASSEDVRSVDAVGKIVAIHNATTRKLILENCGHGTEMLGCNSSVISAILDFISANL